MIEYSKLVRDNIPDIIFKNGKKPFIRILNEEEYECSLMNKLNEEYNELKVVLSNKYFDSIDIAKELADFLEVGLAILKNKGMTEKEFNSIRLDKLKERGGFDKKIFLIGIEE